MNTIRYFTLTLLILITLIGARNTTAQDISPEYFVRIVYVIPRDQTPDPNIDTTLDLLIKDVQHLYAQAMEKRGLGSKTFRIETNETGTVRVHRLHSEYDSGYYPYSDQQVISPTKEMAQKFGPGYSLNNVYVYVVETDDDINDLAPGLCGLGASHEAGQKGTVIIPNAMECSGAPIATILAHELGHAFGLDHDFRGYNILSYAISADKLTHCHALWLDKSRYFNTITDQENVNSNTQIETPHLSTAPPLPYGIRVQFEVSDSDGLYQAQLMEFEGFEWILRGCKQLNGDRSTVEFVSTSLAAASNDLILRLKVMDIYGNITSRDFFKVDISPYTPDASEPVQIPDANLEASVRKVLGDSTSTITIGQMQQIERLDLSDGSITDLTGLEHAINIGFLNIRYSQITDLTPLAGLPNLRHLIITHSPISDITPLSGLTALRSLWLQSNQISDITPLAGLFNLESLYLSYNQISDITPLSGLTALRELYIVSNQISDVRPLLGLSNLEHLQIWDNRRIKNRKPLLELLRSNPGIEIYLTGSSEPLPVTLSSFRAEHTDAGVVLNWTTESELDNAGFFIYRSETKAGDFKVVNPTLIAGAGTTGERNEYTWMDTTAKPNTVYYYRIEDVSHAGERKQIATVRLRGLVSAKDKMLMRWSQLK